MKRLTTVFLLFSSFLMAQQDSSTTDSRKIPNYSNPNLENVGIYAALNGTYTEGVLKDFVNPIGSISLGVEKRLRHLYAFNLTFYPTILERTFTNDNRVWQKDTAIILVTLQGSFGYQFWTSKRMTLYLFGALGIHSLSAGSSNNSNQNNSSCNCDKKEQSWTLISVAPSAGFFFDFREKKQQPSFFGQTPRNAYWRLKLAISPAWFQQIGHGIFYDIGIGYTI
jgi:hypothetical protein